MSDLLDLLDEYLSSDEAPNDSMQLSDLDGFLTGIACSPEPILPAEFMDVVWGSGKTPNSAKHYQAINRIIARYNQIVAGLNGEPSHIEPVFWQSEDGDVIAMDWCEGFVEAYSLRMDLWSELVKTPNGEGLLFPIMVHLFDDEGKSVMGIPDDEVEQTLDFAAKEITNTVPLIFAYWQSKRSRSH